MRFGLKRKKENGFSFYALHQNQLLSEVLFSTAGLFLKNLFILLSGQKTLASLSVLSGFAFGEFEI